MTSPFNSYDENGYRETITGCKSSKIEDEAIIYNLRFRWEKELAEYSDAQIVNLYDEFALSEMWGDNDERFLEFIKE
jgi:hypothetical protein